MYTHRMTIAVPLAIKPIAAKLGKSFDPDVGGDKSFDILVANDVDGNLYCICDAPSTEDLATGAQAMLADKTGTTLFGYTTNDYNLRWSDLVGPTLDECAEFLSKAFITIEPNGREYLDVIGEMGLTPVLLPQ